MADPISYLALQDGTEVRAADGTRIGTVDRVLQDDALDVFTGLVVRTGAGTRFLDSAAITAITTDAVSTSLTPDEAARLPEPDGTPVYAVDPDALADDAGGRGDAAPLLRADEGDDPGAR